MDSPARADPGIGGPLLGRTVRKRDHDWAIGRYDGGTGLDRVISLLTLVQAVTGRCALRAWG